MRSQLIKTVNMYKNNILAIPMLFKPLHKHKKTILRSIYSLTLLLWSLPTMTAPVFLLLYCFLIATIPHKFYCYFGHQHTTLFCGNWISYTLPIFADLWHSFQKYPNMLYSFWFSPSGSLPSFVFLSLFQLFCNPHCFCSSAGPAWECIKMQLVLHGLHSSC